MKWKAPANSTMVSVGGQSFPIAEDGSFETPDDGNYHAMLAHSGCTPWVDAPAVDPNPPTDPQTGETLAPADDSGADDSADPSAPKRGKKKDA